MLRFVWAFGASAALLLASASVALAGDTWCDTDPPVAVTTPAGNMVLVYVVDSGPVDHLASLLDPQISYSVQSVASGQSTNVKMAVTVANDSLGSDYGVGTEVWSGPLRTGVEYASAQGESGQPLNLQFRLPVS